MSDQFFFPSTGIGVRRALLLAIDDVSLPLRRNLCYYITRPAVRPEPVLTPSQDRDAPDGCATHFCGGVVHENGLFRMWYYAVHYGQGRVRSSYLPVAVGSRCTPTVHAICASRLAMNGSTCCRLTQGSRAAGLEAKVNWNVRSRGLEATLNGSAGKLCASASI